jgi:ankyrin repeat protein
MVRLLLDHGADVNILDKLRRNCLLNAARAGRVDLVRMLLERGADPRLTSSFNNETVLHDISVSGVPNENAIIKLLLDHGADINARTTHGETPLHKLACRKDALGTARLLIERGADTQARYTVRGPYAKAKIGAGGEGFTAAEIAEQCRNSDMAEILSLR